MIICDLCEAKESPGIGISKIACGNVTGLNPQNG